MSDWDCGVAGPAMPAIGALKSQNTIPSPMVTVRVLELYAGADIKCDFVCLNLANYSLTDLGRTDRHHLKYSIGKTDLSINEASKWKTLPVLHSCHCRLTTMARFLLILNLPYERIGLHQSTR